MGLMDMMDSHLVCATYRIQGTAAEAARMAHAVIYEQTVELPPEQVKGTPAEACLGHVEAIFPDPEIIGAHRVHIDFPVELACGQLGQLFNLLYGNISMYRGIRLLDANLPGSLLSSWNGPRYGGDGLRRLTGVHGRPLLATAIKPRGLPLANLAGLAGSFAHGGGDIVKDDQNLVHADFDGFRAHVDACADAVDQANAATGRRCLYLPHLSGPDEELERRAEYVHRRGLAGALLCPLVLGLDRARMLAERYQLLFMAHPALSGAYTNGEREGISPAVLLGTFFRLAGADISVFPSPGGRFAVSDEDCAGIGTALQAPLAGLASALPAPGGGLQPGQVEELSLHYGSEAVWLLGGSLHGAEGGIEAGTRRLLDAMRARFGERLEEPRAAWASACELPGGGTAEDVRSLLAVSDDFSWTKRENRRYKDGQALPFRGVRRVELVGKQGEPCSFELRYFELEPGGYTSLEKHVHTHVLIGARGQGLVIIGEERQALKPDDIAYIAPLQVHQLRNEGDGPFGFYCIVDKDRDRPMAP